jgi:hypothetical protein
MRLSHFREQFRFITSAPSDNKANEMKKCSAAVILFAIFRTCLEHYEQDCHTEWHYPSLSWRIIFMFCQKATSITQECVTGVLGATGAARNGPTTQWGRGDPPPPPKNIVLQKLAVSIQKDGPLLSQIKFCLKFYSVMAIGLVLG